MIKANNAGKGLTNSVLQQNFVFLTFILVPIILLVNILLHISMNINVHCILLNLYIMFLMYLFMLILVGLLNRKLVKKQQIFSTKHFTYSMPCNKIHKMKFLQC